jgi:hypothetical protein
LARRSNRTLSLPTRRQARENKKGAREKKVPCAFFVFTRLPIGRQAQWAIRAPGQGENRVANDADSVKSNMETPITWQKVKGGEAISFFLCFG